MVAVGTSQQAGLYSSFRSDFTPRVRTKGKARETCLYSGTSFSTN
uniref:Uncharacterized protein n=1 Tax=Utricularia reniformis TaxID=192314 RepID=A0A1Y0B1M0_9LAMI|nr:hypothetical protein AEK19_MT1027 [Utricularia reniformis]ART31249.1 hypothetical protein AEK19_MT1027 [Utricularia reniformis]